MFSKLHAVYGKWPWLACGDWPSTGGVLNITAAVCTAGFQWWHSGNKKRTHNVSEYMLVLALCLIYLAGQVDVEMIDPVQCGDAGLN